MSAWSGVACDAGGDESPTLAFYYKIAVGALAAAIICNEASAVAAVAAAGHLGLRRDGFAWLLRRAPVGLAYAACLASTGGAIALSTCGCGASASLAWYSVAMQFATVAAAWLCAEASEAAAEGEAVGGGGGGGEAEGENGTLLAASPAAP